MCLHVDDDPAATRPLPLATPPAHLLADPGSFVAEYRAALEAAGADQ